MFDMIFPSNEDTLLFVASFEAESLALVSEANSLARVVSESRGEHRALLEEKIRKLLYDAAASYPPNAYKGGCAPYITKKGIPWRKPWVI